MRNVRIATSSLATLEAITPPNNLRVPSVNENLSRGLDILDVAGANKVDIAVLCESFAYAGIPGDNLREVVETYPGNCITEVAKKAKHYSMYVVAGFYVVIEGKIKNISVLFDRSGNIVGEYVKKYATQGEMDCGVFPEDTQNVFTTDFGKIGMSICFDINWPDVWTSLENEAEIVFWISAYEGGFPLQARAWLHHLPIVSAVMSYHGKVIDINGKVLGQTSRWNRVYVHEFNLDREILHTDHNYSKIAQIQSKYGAKVSIESSSEEHFYIIQSNDESITVKSILEEFDIQTYREYIAQCTEDVRKSKG